MTDFSLFLTVKHPTSDLSGLSSELRLSAVRVWKAGESRTTPKGTPLPGLYRDSYCGLSILKVEGLGLSESICRLLDCLNPNRRILDQLIATGGSLMLIIRWYNSGNTGEEFAPELLRRLANMNITLGIDVYDISKSSCDV